jgi:uncharacterized membrane protein
MRRSRRRRRLHEQLAFAKAYAQHRPHLARVIERNIETLLELRRQADACRSLQDKVADWITRFSGSMLFVYLHVIWFALWVIINEGWLERFHLQPFDEFPFGLLTLIVSLEAIFLSAFVLLSQNRQGEIADERADLDLQINLLSEHEITRILSLVDAIAIHLRLDEAKDPEIEELKQEVKPDLVIREIDEMKRALGLQQTKKPNGKNGPNEKGHPSDDKAESQKSQGDHKGDKKHRQ